MGAPTEYYVDYSGGNDTTGDGSSGTPWKTLQKALNTITRDTTNGDRINIKSTTAEILSSAIVDTTYGNATNTAPLILEGYTSTAGDGGIATLDGNNSVAVYNDNTSADHRVWRNIIFRNSANNQLVFCGANNHFFNCEFNTAGSGGGLRTGGACIIWGCRFESLGGFALRQDSTGIVRYCYFKNGANVASRFSNAPICMDNIFNVNGSGSTICMDVGSAAVILRNRCYGAASTGKGLNTTAAGALLIEGNYFEGFSGAGGVGLNAAHDVYCIRRNYYYNNTTARVVQDVAEDDDGTTLSGSAYVDAASEDFSINNTSGAGATLRALSTVIVA